MVNNILNFSMINATDEDKEALAEIQKDKSKIQMERKLSQKPETFENQENFEIHENNNIKESSKINENFQTDQSEKRTTVLKPESVMTENHNENVSRHIKVRHIKTQSRIKIVYFRLFQLRIQMVHLRERWSILLHFSFKLHFLLFYYGVYIYTQFLKHYIPYFIASKTISRTVLWKSKFSSGTGVVPMW